MPDVFTKEKRSSIMRQVRSSRNKSTELKLISFFEINKVKGWRRNYQLFGKPDFVFPRNRIVIFLDGCFWHGHDCRNTKPKDNYEYWNNKIKRNQLRDKLVTETLSHKNWTVIRLWECCLKNQKFLEDELLNLLNNPNLLKTYSSASHLSA